MQTAHGGIVTGFQATALSVAPTCSQYHGNGRRTGLKIRWGNTRVGSSPTFGTETIAVQRYELLQAFRSDTSATPPACPPAALCFLLQMPRSMCA